MRRGTAPAAPLYVYKLDCYDKTATIENIKSILSGMGGLSSTTANTPLRFSEIQTAINGSQPFILRWVWSSGGAHFVVGTGWEVDDTGVQSVYLSDPGPVGYGEVRKETYDYVRGGSGYGQTWTHSLYNVKKQ